MGGVATTSTINKTTAVAMGGVTTVVMSAMRTVAATTRVTEEEVGVAGAAVGVGTTAAQAEVATTV